MFWYLNINSFFKSVYAGEKKKKAIEGPVPVTGRWGAGSLWRNLLEQQELLDEGSRGQDAARLHVGYNAGS